MIPSVKLSQSTEIEREQSFFDLPLQAIWFGLLAGLLEVAVWVVQKTFFDPFGYLGRDLVWMAPLANALAFLIPGCLLAVFTHRVRTRLGQGFGTFILALLAVLSLVFLTYKLHPIAALPLAVGLAYQIARLAGRYNVAFNRLIRRSSPWLVMLLLCLMVTAQGWRAIGERDVVADRLENSSRNPNVLLIVLDTVRAGSLSLYGYQKQTTPNLEDLAREGAYFESALATSPWTLPSHASMFTGRYPHELSSGWYASLDGTYPTLAEVLGGFGYSSAGFVANTPYCSYETGLNRGFEHFEDYSVSLAELLRSSSLIRRTMLQFFGLRRLTGQYDILGRKNAAQVNDAFLSWLDQDSKRPFFAFLNYFDAHDPYLPQSLRQEPDSWTREQYRLACSWWFMDKEHLTLQQVEEAKSAYESCIAYLDGQIGRLIDELRSRDLLDETIVVITSDHGEMFGEHGLYGHGNSLYRSVLQVPLLIIYPAKVPAGFKVAQSVSLRDIPSTILDLAGHESAHPIPGASLSRYWGEPGATELVADVVLSELDAPCRIPPDHGRSPVAAGRMKAVLQNGKMYIKNYGSGREELYDFELDRDEQADLVQAIESEGILRDMRRYLDQSTRERVR